MSVEIVRFETAKPAPDMQAAGRYVALAEQAIAMIADADDEHREAIRTISEMWLSLAEDKLGSIPRG